MRRRVGLMETVMTSIPRLTHFHANYCHACERCVEVIRCTIGDPRKCKTGIIHPIGCFGTNFSLAARSRTEAIWGGKKKGG